MKTLITHPAYLNHSDADELLAHRHLLPLSVVDRLKATDRRIDRWPDRFARPNQLYRQQAALIAMLDSTRVDGLQDPLEQISVSECNFAKRFCMCCVGDVPCGLWKLCHYCAWCRKMNLQEKFLLKYSGRRWFFITIAYTGVVHVGSGYDGSLPVYWDAGVDAIRCMVADGVFKGAVWSEEMHIVSLLDGAVQPHVHALICADDLTMDHIDRIRALVREHRGTSWNLQTGQNERDEHERVRLPVTTKTRLIESRWHLANSLSYLCKPMALAETYQAEWARITERNRKRAIFLNQAVSDVLGAFSVSKHNRRQLDYRGNLDARSRTKFIGASRQERRSRIHRERVRELLENLNSENSRFYNADDPTQWGPTIESEPITSC